LDRLVYIGFGSIWFTDFVMAHKLLRIDDMVSIESNDIGYRRAAFNSPYATVIVKHGLSGQVLATLFDDPKLSGRPWMIWLDYDYEFKESIKDDLQSLIEKAPVNTVILTTFSGVESRYGKPADRPGRLRQLFGPIVPDEFPTTSCRNESMHSTLADFTLDFMTSTAATMARPGGFVPAFRILYKDSTPMVTVGGILPAQEAAHIVVDAVKRPDWPCRPEKVINVPHLTLKEAAVLQAQLPRVGSLTRAFIQTLGFDLEPQQIEAFEKYYRQYPTFAQILL
jgi:hypothetical protein